MVTFSEQLSEQRILNPHATELHISHAAWAQVLREREAAILTPILVTKEALPFMGLRVVKRDGPIVFK